MAKHRIKDLLEKVSRLRGDSGSPTVTDLLEFMELHHIPRDAMLDYEWCGDHDLTIYWTDDRPLIEGVDEPEAGR